MATEHRTRGSIQMMEDISRTLSQDGGTFGLAYDPERKEWMASMEWGREAPDSPMVGAASYALGPSAGDAIEQMLKEAGI